MVSNHDLASFIEQVVFAGNGVPQALLRHKHLKFIQNMNLIRSKDDCEVEVTLGWGGKLGAPGGQWDLNELDHINCLEFKAVLTCYLWLASQRTLLHCDSNKSLSRQCGSCQRSKRRLRKCTLNNFMVDLVQQKKGKIAFPIRS
ncbi:uncharacterized protein LOC123519894 [Portunus trituberculatus]|uniref:uncharacterized protein LOC123519894 n=1 Tax=Portunus trituberculatus TaxID=210409 RepID=UPI001E1CC73E|nr:uncharacterized protein LOC123519894 [Portunus trituberculatus]